MNGSSARERRQAHPTGHIRGQQMSLEQRLEELESLVASGRVPATSRTLVKDEQTLLILIKPKILIQTEQEELAFPSFTQP